MQSSLDQHVLRCVNAYFHWLHVEHGQPLIKIPKLKKPQKILTTSVRQVLKALVDLRLSTTSTRLHRAYMIAITILNTGLRVDEVLSLHKADIKFDALQC